MQEELTPVTAVAMLFAPAPALAKMRPKTRAVPVLLHALHPCLKNLPRSFATVFALKKKQKSAAVAVTTTAAATINAIAAATTSATAAFFPAFADGNLKTECAMFYAGTAINKWGK